MLIIKWVMKCKKKLSWKATKFHVGNINITHLLRNINITHDSHIKLLGKKIIQTSYPCISN